MKRFRSVVSILILAALLLVSCASGNVRLTYEEGKLINLECNRFFPEIQDIICGPIIAIGHDDDGASVSLTDEQVQEAIRMFTMQYPPARFARIGNGILIDPNWDWKPDTTARWYFLEEK